MLPSPMPKQSNDVEKVIDILDDFNDNHNTYNVASYDMTLYKLPTGSLYSRVVSAYGKALAEFPINRDANTGAVKEDVDQSEKNSINENILTRLFLTNKQLLTVGKEIKECLPCKQNERISEMNNLVLKRYVRDNSRGISNLLTEQELLASDNALEHIFDMQDLALAEHASLLIVQATNEAISELEAIDNKSGATNLDEFSIFDRLESQNNYMLTESEDFENLVISLFESLKKFDEDDDIESAKELFMIETAVAVSSAVQKTGLATRAKEGASKIRDRVVQAVKNKYYNIIQKLMQRKAGLAVKRREALAAAAPGGEISKLPTKERASIMQKYMDSMKQVDADISEFRRKAAEAAGKVVSS